MKELITYLKKLLKKYIGGSQYKKNVLIMIVGRTVAQAIPILLTPLLTKIYTPADFGVFAVFSTIVSIISMLSNGRYPLAIILPKDEKKSSKIFFLASILTTITVIISGILMFVFKKEIFSMLNSEILGKYVLIITLNILAVGFYENLYYYALRLKAFRVLTTNVIVQSLILISSRIILGYLGFTEFGLLVSYLLGYSFTSISMAIRLNVPFRELFTELNLKDYLKLMKEYYKFPKYSLLADTLSSLSNMSPNILINKAFGTVYTGYYNMSDKVLGSPIWLITASVGDVFKQEASEQFRTKGSCFELFRKTAFGMFLIGILPFAGIFILSPYVIPFLLGDEWSLVGDFIRIFSVMYFIKFIVRPVYPVLYIVRKQNYNAIFQGLHLFAIIVAFIIGIYTKDWFLCILSWSLLSSFVYLIILFFSYRFAKETRYDPLQD